ncbi:NAD(P)/FAD-dependent oxidoreductase [Skermanella mucosa]|uniref:NAD(P)/FAD-dependent oxidoreductase n=1 Tax=Skermanella mucosa TaxID=1789672 RepID=UPI00192C4F09|nr:NAD(P)/FAD-dependent oxidoreductase [Skermanella mucosa]UEM21803.1 NAD(P)/FAD-dependent oxidoreductase [Skermanella mucosa]
MTAAKEAADPHSAAAPAGRHDGRAGGRPRVVVIGAGFAGLAAANELGGKEIDVTLIDRRNYHLFVPLLYQVASAALSPADIAEPIRRIVSRHANIEVMLGEVVGIDKEARSVALADGSAVSYDRLVVATGSTHSYFGHDEWERHATGLKTIEDARQIRGRVLMAFEQAEICPDPAKQQSLMTTVIVGAGPTGVEMAGAIAELSRHTLARDFRNIDPETARVILVEAGPRVLPAFPPELSEYAHRALTKLGVTVMVDTPVEDVTAEGVTVGGRVVPAGTIVWGAGVRASPAGTWLDVETDKAGRVKVGDDLGVPGHPDIFVLGDTALAMHDDGQPLPGLAQVAKQQGEHVGRHLHAHLTRGEPMPPFRFKNRGNLATIGRNSAVADFGKTKLKGFVAWLLWGVVHVYLLIGFRNRLLVTMQWLVAYATYQRGARLITGERKAPVRENRRQARPAE